MGKGVVNLRPPPRNRPLDADAYLRAGQPVFLTVRAAGQTRPFVSLPLNVAMIDVLLRERLRSGCSVYAYCLMPDHLHLLVSPAIDGRSVLDMLRRFKGASTRVAWPFVGTARLWQPRYFDRVLRSDEAVEKVAQYILDNPVRRGMVATQSDYAWGALVDPIPM